MKELIAEVVEEKGAWLVEAFPWSPTLWTNSYFVATVGGAPLPVIHRFVERQQTWWRPC